MEKYVQILSNAVVFLGEKIEIELIQTQLNQMKEEQAKLPEIKDVYCNWPYLELQPRVGQILPN